MSDNIRFMIRLQAYKFRLKTKTKKAQTLRRFAGSCRYVYNHALKLQKSRHEQGEKKLSYAGLCKVLGQWKRDEDTVWLNKAPSQSLQQSLKDLDRAYQNFFAKRADFPQFKKRGKRDAFRYPQGFKLDQANHRIYLPKIGWMKYFNSQKVLGEIKNVTLSQKAGAWYVSIQTEREAPIPIHEKSDMIGIDVGIAKLAVLSNKQVHESCHALKAKLEQLKYQQRQLSKKIKFSQNWLKQKKRLSQLYHQIANTRLDDLHKASYGISKNHAILVLEDLQIKNMSKSASGTLDAPGKKVKAKSGLNRAILDQSWGEFRRQLMYKAKWLGGDVLLVNPKYTSQTCPQPNCNYVSKENRKTQSDFECIVCGFKENADYVAALNILAAGHAVLACGEKVLLGLSMKQEPTRSAA
jgi:putative transposase